MKSNIAKHLSRAMRVSASVASLLVFSSISARGESAAGLVRADVESGGFALVGLPFHPFSNVGGVGGVLDGTFLGGAGPHVSDAASVWRSGPQAWTNAWFGPDGVWLGLEDYPFRAGDAFWLHNRQTAPLLVFARGVVPFDEEIETFLFPGLNLSSSPYPSAVEGADATRALGAGFWLENAEPFGVELPWRRPYPAPTNAPSSPRIAEIAIDASSGAASALIESGSATVDVLSLNAERFGAFSDAGWRVEGRVPPGASGSFWWDDPGFADFLSDTNNAARFYLVGDAGLDSDGDGLPDLLERWFYGTDPYLADTDSDGADDGAELMSGRDPLVPDAPSDFGFIERFEPDTVSPGAIGGQNGWEENTPGAGLAQSWKVFDGFGALRLFAEEGAGAAVVSRSFSDAPPVVWADLRQTVEPADLRSLGEPSGTAAAFCFDTNNRLTVLDWKKPSGSRWTAVPGARRPGDGEWVRITLRLDYAAREWDVWFEGELAASGLGLGSLAPSLNAVSFEGRSGFYDDVSVAPSRPAGLSSDGNGIPDEWEIEHFGAIGRDPRADPDGDGLTNYEEWLSGTSPFNRDSDFDALPDGWEVLNGLDPADASDASADPDRDGMSTAEEHALGLDPFAFNLDPRVWQNGVDALYKAFAALSDFPSPDADPLAVAARVESQINHPAGSGSWPGLPVGFSSSFASVHESWLFVPESGYYEFDLRSDDGSRLWIDGALVIDNGGNHSMLSKRAVLPLPQGLRKIRVEYFNGAGAGGLVLKHSGPGIPECAIPPGSLFRLVGERDADADGMDDWWEALHGVSDPGADPDADGLANLQEFLAGTSPSNPFSGGGLISDAWNVANGVNPFAADNGAYSTSGGLSNFERQLYGVGPWDKRFNEPPQTVETILPSDADAALGAWFRNEEALGVNSRKGGVAFTNDLEIAAPGIYQIVVNGAGRNTQSSFLACELDGISLGVAALSSFHDAASSGSGSSAVEFYTQWLPAGTHPLVMKFDNIFNGVKFEIHSVEINAFGGDDADENGRPDWLDARLAVNSVSRPGAVQSKVSPYCMTGTAAFLPLAGASVPAGPLVIKPLPRKGWWANVPLDASAPAPVTISYENGALAESVSVEWAPFNPFSEGDVVLRAGDSLLLAGHPEFATEISVDGVANAVLAPGQTTPFMFSNHKTYSVSAQYEDGAGTIRSANVKVTAVRASVPEYIPVWQGKVSTAYFEDFPAKVSGVPSNILLASPVSIDTELEIASEAPHGASGRKISFATPKRVHPKNIALKISNPDASVLDSAPFASFYAYYTVEGVYHVVETLPDGAHVVENRLTTGGLPGDVTLRMRFYMSGICFDDGALERTVRGEDLDALGELDYLMYSTATYLCHYIEAYHDGNIIAK